jgi:predicted nuclease of predicted toxin-antitoxin system
MKIKLDENLPASLVEGLMPLGHDVDTVVQEGLAGAIDPEVWRVAQNEARFLITQDLDFSDIRQFAPGSHHGIMLVRLREPGRKALYRYVVQAFADEDTTDWPGCFIVLSDHKLRVLRP